MDRVGRGPPRRAPGARLHPGHVREHLEAPGRQVPRRARALHAGGGADLLLLHRVVDAGLDLGLAPRRHAGARPGGDAGLLQVLRGPAERHRARLLDPVRLLLHHHRHQLLRGEQGPHGGHRAAGQDRHADPVRLRRHPGGPRADPRHPRRHGGRGADPVEPDRRAQLHVHARTGALLGNPKVWLAATGQIFFTLSVGMGSLQAYAQLPDEEGRHRALRHRHRGHQRDRRGGAGRLAGHPGRRRPSSAWPAPSPSPRAAASTSASSPCRWCSTSSRAGRSWPPPRASCGSGCSSSPASPPRWPWPRRRCRSSRRTSAGRGSGRPGRSAAIALLLGLLHIVYYTRGFLDEWDYWAGTFGLVILRARRDDPLRLGLRARQRVEGDPRGRQHPDPDASSSSS